MREKGMTTITLKKINRDKVYQYIYNQKETSKLQIVQDLQMGLSTVSQNLNELENDGLISRNGYFESTGGRKAQIIRIVEDYRISIGLGILKDMFHIAAVNLYGDAIASETIGLPYENSDAYYSTLAENVERFIQDHQYLPEKISGISIATQGIISPDGTAVTYGNIMGNTKMQLSDFSSRLPYPCHLEHDSKAAADLELWNHPQFDSALIFLLNQNLGTCAADFLSISALIRMDRHAIAATADALKPIVQRMHSKLPPVCQSVNFSTSCITHRHRLFHRSGRIIWIILLLQSAI